MADLENVAVVPCAEWISVGPLRFTCQKPVGHEGNHEVLFSSANIDAGIGWVRKEEAPPPAKKPGKKAKAAKKAAPGKAAKKVAAKKASAYRDGPRAKHGIG